MSEQLKGAEQEGDAGESSNADGWQTLRSEVPFNPDPQDRVASITLKKAKLQNGTQAVEIGIPGRRGIIFDNKKGQEGQKGEQLGLTDNDKKYYPESVVRRAIHDSIHKAPEGTMVVDVDKQEKLNPDAAVEAIIDKAKDNDDTIRIEYDERFPFHDARRILAEKAQKVLGSFIKGRKKNEGEKRLANEVYISHESVMEALSGYVFETTVFNADVDVVDPPQPETARKSRKIGAIIAALTLSLSLLFATRTGDDTFAANHRGDIVPPAPVTVTMEDETKAMPETETEFATPETELATQETEAATESATEVSGVPEVTPVGDSDTTPEATSQGESELKKYAGLRIGDSVQVEEGTIVHESADYAHGGANREGVIGGALLPSDRDYTIAGFYVLDQESLQEGEFKTLQEGEGLGEYLQEVAESLSGDASSDADSLINPDTIEVLLATEGGYVGFVDVGDLVVI